jgi:hypothetical protein
VKSKDKEPSQADYRKALVDELEQIDTARADAIKKEIRE